MFRTPRLGSIPARLLRHRLALLATLIATAYRFSIGSARCAARAGPHP